MGQSYFANDGAQPYFILQAALLYLKRLSDTEKVT